MKESVYINLGASNHSKGERQAEDYYATDPIAAKLLLRVEPQLNNIWECACGEGHLAKVFDNYGKLAKATDLINRSYGNRTKTSASTRVVNLCDKIIEIIRWHIKNFDIKTGFLFKNKNGNPVSSKNVSRKFKKLLKITGYPENYMRVHDLRGEYVDLLHSCGIATEYISKQVGHSKTSTTSDIYTQILDDIPVSAMERLNKKITE